MKYSPLFLLLIFFHCENDPLSLDEFSPPPNIYDYFVKADTSIKHIGYFDINDLKGNWDTNYYQWDYEHGKIRRFTQFWNSVEWDYYPNGFNSGSCNNSCMRWCSEYFYLPTNKRVVEKYRLPDHGDGSSDTLKYLLTYNDLLLPVNLKYAADDSLVEHYEYDSLSRLTRISQLYDTASISYAADGMIKTIDLNQKFLIEQTTFCNGLPYKLRYLRKNDLSLISESEWIIIW